MLRERSMVMVWMHPLATMMAVGVAVLVEALF